MFLTFWYTILCYSLVFSVKKKNFTSKRKTIFCQAALFFSVLCRMDIIYDLIIYQSSITMH